jgi:PAS domain S-box-containing protein
MGSDSRRLGTNSSGADELEQLRAENAMLRDELRVSREAATISAELVIAQFEETEKMMSRLELARAEREAIFDAASKVAVIVTKLDGRITLFSRGAELLLGYRAAEVVGRKSLTEFLLPAEIRQLSSTLTGGSDQPVTAPQLFAELVRQGASDPLEWNYVRKNGTRVPISLSITGLRDSAGAISGYVGAAMDMSASRHIQEELQARQAALVDAEERLLSIIEMLPDATMVIDLNGRVMFWNRAMETLTGVPAAEMVGQDNHAYALPFYGERRPILIDIALRPDAFRPGAYTAIEVRGDTIWAEVAIEGMRGRTFYLRGSASVLRDRTGQAVGAIETIFDITERRQMIEALRQSKEAAESANKAKSMFFATMTHELRTPLNAIIGFSEFVATQTFGPVGDPAYLEHADYALHSARHLLDMVNGMLDFSKIEAGMMKLERVQIPLAHLLKRCARMVEDLALRAGVTIKVAVPPNIAYLSGDERAIRQILINLLDNAIKFNVRQGSILLTALQVGEFIEIVVADTGAGIPAEAIERVVKPFEQINNQYSRAQGGTGLGLSIVEGLVRLHGGTLSIASAVGKGTAVTLRFPIAAAPDTPLSETTETGNS